MKKMIALGLLLISTATARAQMRLPQCQANAVCPTFAAPNFEILPGGVLIWPDGSTSNSAAQAGTVPAGSVTAGTFGAGVLLPAAQVVAGALGSGITISAPGVRAGSLGTGVTLSTANVVPGFNGANELVQFNGSGAYPAADGSLLTYSAAGAGAIPFFTSGGGALSTNASKLYWDNTNFRLGLRTTAPTHALQISSGTLYIDGNSPTPIQIGDNGSTMTLTNAGNLTIAGALDAHTSSVTAGAFFGNGYNITNVSISSCTTIPNSAFTNTTFGVALGTATLTSRGFPLFVSLQSTARGSAGTTVVECTLMVDGAFGSNVGQKTVASERTPTSAADFTFPIPRSQLVQANGTPYPAGSHSVALACMVNSGTGTILFDATHYNRLCVTEFP